MALEINHLTRKFGDRTAVDDVSFKVHDGRLTGFVGANGAGKTTVMRMILGVLGPNAGDVTMNGQPLNEPMRRSFGYMPEERGLYPKMKVREQLIYFARLHGLSKLQAAGNADELLQLLNLQERANDPVETLSLGNQQRAQVAVSLVHSPSALILDEPFSGLDPIAVDTILAVLEANAARGIPVLLSSHQLDLVERLCDDLVIISEGRVVAQGSIAELQRQYSKDLYRVSMRGPLDWLQARPDTRLIEQLEGDDPTISSAIVKIAQADADFGPQSVLRAALDQGEVIGFAPETTRLSAIFKEAVQGSAEDEQQTGAAR